MLLPIGLREASRTELERMHSGTYLDALHKIERADQAPQIRGDNPFLEGTIPTARLAAGSVITAIDSVMAGEIRNAFCAVRPPGHHAFPDRWEGFCYLNNIAIGAKHLVKHHGLSRVLVLDWDLHHGNGTQECFFNDPKVLVINMHGDPTNFYPFRSGFERERGIGAGVGFNLNIPLPKGSGDDLMMARFNDSVVPIVRDFRPEFVLISAGFDAHEQDPFRFLCWSDDGYRWITERTLDLADEFASGRYVSVLEGGYELEVLRRVVPLHVDQLIARAGVR
jgi:acetoin utilization deacetylase AcuC-like enzyme